MSSKDWTGNDVICDRCDSKNTEHLYDEYHDAHDEGACQVFRCNNCKNTMHIELPDEHHSKPRG